MPVSPHDAVQAELHLRPAGQLVGLLAVLHLREQGAAARDGRVAGGRH